MMNSTIHLPGRETPASAPGATGSLGSLPGALDALGRATALDAVVEPLLKAVRGLPLGGLRDVLHGTRLGHPLHPALVHVPLGAWLSAAVLDLLPGTERSARTLVGVGVAAAGPTALAGWVDWAELHPQQQRTGVVHAACNVLAVGLYAGSWTARRCGRSGLGRGLGYAGLTAVGAGGALGGHLAFRQAAGANHAEAVAQVVEPGWHVIGPADRFPPGEPVRVMVGEVPVVVVRTAGADARADAEGAVRVLADRCSHLSGPLSEGEVADGCIRCPWHGSVFRLVDGANVEGPATAPQPRFEVRRSGGDLEVRFVGD